MKAHYLISAAMLITAMAQAKTYTISSGQWNDPAVWGNQYIGTTIPAGDVVIITGKINMNAPLVVDGKLEIENGGALIGMKALTIGKKGSFVNNGITVVERIVNAGSVVNNSLMKTMMDKSNQPPVLDYPTIVAGNNNNNEVSGETAKAGSSSDNNAGSQSQSTPQAGLSTCLFRAPDIKNADFCAY